MWPHSGRAGSSGNGDSIRIVWSFSTKRGSKRTWFAPAVGQRLVCDVPHGHWKTTTFLAALRVRGLTAPLVVDGAINGAIFRRWVEQHLVPTLHEGDVVIMDNLASHKVAGVQSAIRGAGAEVCYLPPYSPDLNPIETVFSKFKWFVKSAARRTVDALWKACGAACRTISSRLRATSSGTA